MWLCNQKVTQMDEPAVSRPAAAALLASARSRWFIEMLAVVLHVVFIVANLRNHVAVLKVISQHNNTFLVDKTSSL